MRGKTFGKPYARRLPILPGSSLWAASLIWSSECQQSWRTWQGRCQHPRPSLKVLPFLREKAHHWCSMTQQGASCGTPNQAGYWLGPGVPNQIAASIRDQSRSSCQEGQACSRVVVMWQQSLGSWDGICPFHRRPICLMVGLAPLPLAATSPLHVVHTSCSQSCLHIALQTSRGCYHIRTRVCVVRAWC